MEARSKLMNQTTFCSLQVYCPTGFEVFENSLKKMMFETNRILSLTAKEIEVKRVLPGLLENPL